MGVDYEPEFDSLKDLLLEIAQERSTEALLQEIVRRLADRPHVVLSRIWLVETDDRCDSCQRDARCNSDGPCLHLVASAGSSAAGTEHSSCLDGRFSRFPLGVGNIGQIVATGEPLEVSDFDGEEHWLIDPEWARREGIRGLVGQPLIYQGEVLGVVAVFLRTLPSAEGAAWLRIIADHAATSITNTRAFETIERLRKRLELERDYLREEVREAQFFGDIVGQSPALANIMAQIKLVAPTDASVLILGESGTGKELVAREIHKMSLRREHPMIKVNCASVPRELYESEFFGHVKGAFTGALRDRAGRFELADGGTLFLDEVGEIPLDLQGKLLRVLQEGEFERVGEEGTRAVDVRIIAATNHDLKQEIAAGRFRQDLYYRLNVFPLEVAPLRGRKEDIPLLALRFAEHAALRLNCPLPRVTQANILELQRYDWPGNVRELQNVIERAAITARSGVLQFDLPESESGFSGDFIPAIDPRTPGPEIVTDAEMQRRQRDNIVAALQQTGWKVYGPGGAAELLRLKPTTLASRMKKMRIKRPQ
ncbi:MAG TPA: sigma 54-interacting transcriptional regulator [Thermoguttaceae bacterium]|nr:sigma 54-interacting transcriptional regulator [Thermoguttaceae bacterium]